MRTKSNMFIDDEEKIKDLLYLNKEDFLKEYSYITEAEYENTVELVLIYVKGKVKVNKKRTQINRENAEEIRKKNLDYYYKNKDKINARRKELRDMRKKGE